MVQMLSFSSPGCYYLFMVCYFLGLDIITFKVVIIFVLSFFSGTVFGVIVYVFI
jgi:hypothetical protein